MTGWLCRVVDDGVVVEGGEVGVRWRKMTSGGSAGEEWVSFWGLEKGWVWGFLG